MNYKYDIYSLTAEVTKVLRQAQDNAKIAKDLITWPYLCALKHNFVNFAVKNFFKVNKVKGNL